METILDQLYDHPEYYDAAITVIGCTVMSATEFMSQNDYDYREYLNDEIRDHIKTHGGFIALSEWATLNIM